MQRSEDDYRHDVVQMLVEQGGYRREQIALNFPIRFGANKKGGKVDVAVFPAPHARHQDEICMVIECKRSITSQAAFADAEDQLRTYMNVCADAMWGVLFSGLDHYVYIKSNGRVVFAQNQPIPHADQFVVSVAPEVVPQQFDYGNSQSISQLVGSDAFDKMLSRVAASHGMTVEELERSWSDPTVRTAGDEALEAIMRRASAKRTKR